MTKYIKNLIILLILSIVIFSCSSNQPLETEQYIELESYLGDWYEIAKLPTSFENRCKSNVMANYELADQDADYDIIVTNSCELKDDITDEKSVEVGKAWIVDRKTNAKLQVQFSGMPSFIKANYWIIEIGEKNKDGMYSYAVVGNDSRKYLWILSRKPKMDDKLYKSITERIEGKGFNTENLVKTQHY